MCAPPAQGVETSPRISPYTATVFNAALCDFSVVPPASPTRV